MLRSLTSLVRHVTHQQITIRDGQRFGEKTLRWTYLPLPEREQRQEHVCKEKEGRRREKPSLCDIWAIRL